MCTSTKGIAVPSRASRIATLVCVYAAGLMITAIRPFLVLLLLGVDGDGDEVAGVKCECRKSTIAPSWLDWNGTTVMFSCEPRSTRPEMSCLSVVLP